MGTVQKVNGTVLLRRYGTVARSSRTSRTRFLLLVKDFRHMFEIETQHMYDTRRVHLLSAPQRKAEDFVESLDEYQYI